MAAVGVNTAATEKSGRMVTSSGGRFDEAVVACVLLKSLLLAGYGIGTSSGSKF